MHYGPVKAGKQEGGLTWPAYIPLVQRFDTVLFWGGKPRGYSERNEGIRKQGEKLHKNMELSFNAELLVVL